MLTTDRNDPNLHEKEENGQNKAYLVMTDEEIKAGFVRPVRRTYVHTGGKACGVATTMNQVIAETYAANPKFYGATFCMGCGTHLPVSEFSWEDGTIVGS